MQISTLWCLCALHKYSRKFYVYMLSRIPRWWTPLWRWVLVFEEWIYFWFLRLKWGNYNWWVKWAYRNKTLTTILFIRLPRALSNKLLETYTLRWICCTVRLKRSWTQHICKFMIGRRGRKVVHKVNVWK